jgi:ribosomal protein S26
MTRYTNGFGRSIVVCDQCRKDVPQDDSIYSITLGTVKDGYTTRDYDKTETVLCLDCANTVSHVLAITGTRYADSLTLREAA